MPGVEIDKETGDVLKALNSGLSEVDHALAVFKEIPMDQKVEVRDINPFIGKGLFATSDILSGELIAFYPIDVICDADQTFTMKSQEDYDLYRYLNRYIAPVRGGKYAGLVVHINDDQWPYVGHRINDGAAILEYKQTKEDTEKMVNIYNTISMAKSNVELFYLGPFETGLGIYNDRKVFGINAKRNIKKGEELFMHYGPAKWFQYLKHNDINQKKA